ncbi:MAG: RsmE family RNA methyltransferase [Bacteroidota bacterium]
MEYFYTPPGNVSTSSLVIVDEEFNHLTHVMRKKVGDRTTVVDGIGHAYEVTLETIGKHTATCDIHSVRNRLNEPDVNLILAVAILKHTANYDFLVEKCTELGVNKIIPMTTQRTITQHARTDRWQKLALAAMKQSGRCVLPRIESLVTFDEVLQHAAVDTLKLIPHEQISTPHLANIARSNTSNILICIGPEGGFTEVEILNATAAGFQPVSLGRRRLRTETAAITAASMTTSAS